MKLNLTHNLCATRWREISLNEHHPSAQLRQQLSRHTGSEPNDITLSLYDDNDNLIGPVAASLAEAGAKDGYRLHITDDNPYSVLRTISEPVPKFVLSDAEYAARPNNARSFLAALKQADPARFAPAAPATSSLPDLNQVAHERFGVDLPTIKAHGVDCAVRCTGVRGKLLWLGEPSSQLLQDLGLERGVLYGGLRLETSQGVFDGRDSGTGDLLFEAATNRGVLIKLDDLELAEAAEAAEPDEL